MELLNFIHDALFWMAFLGCGQFLGGRFQSWVNGGADDAE